VHIQTCPSANLVMVGSSCPVVAPRECKSRGNNYPDRVGEPTMLTTDTGCHPP
jgi:hypothetical protein